MCIRDRHSPYNIATQADSSGDSFTLSGKKTFVLDGHVADKLIVVARTSGEQAERDGISLFLVDREAEGVSVIRTIMADSRNAANVELSNVKVPSDAIIGELGKGADVVVPALDIARIGISAEMLGSLQECFERTVNYLKERKQFGVAIGSFQALKHRAANMFCEIELSKSCVLEALTALEEDRDAEEVSKLASLTKAKVGETFNMVSREGIQMHGGIGMTDEFYMGFYLKRARVAQMLFGDWKYHTDQAATLSGY